MKLATSRWLFLSVLFALGIITSRAAGPTSLVATPGSDGWLGITYAVDFLPSGNNSGQGANNAPVVSASSGQTVQAGAWTVSIVIGTQTVVWMTGLTPNVPVTISIGGGLWFSKIDCFTVLSKVLR